MNIKEINNKLHFVILDGAAPPMQVFELQALMLNNIMKQVKKKLGWEQLDGICITVPAYFNDVGKNITKAAAEAAGYDMDITIIRTEPEGKYYWQQYLLCFELKK